MKEKNILILLVVIIVAAMALRILNLIDNEIFLILFTPIVGYVLGLKNLGVKTNEKEIQRDD